MVRFPSYSENGHKKTPDVFFVSFSSAQSCQPPLCVASWGTRRNDQNQMVRVKIGGDGYGDTECGGKLKETSCNQGVKLPCCITPWNQ